MPEYRRFVAYFYEYINGKKQKNAGFAKVELRNGMWRILFRLTTEIHPEPPIQVYGFVRESGYLLGLPFGTMRPGREIAEEWAYRAEHSFGNTPYRFENLAGIRVQSGDGRCFMTVWDDEVMEPDKFVLQIPEKTKTRSERVGEAAVEQVDEGVVEQMDEAAVEQMDEAAVERFDENAEKSGQVPEENVDKTIKANQIEEKADETMKSNQASEEIEDDTVKLNHAEMGKVSGNAVIQTERTGTETPGESAVPRNINLNGKIKQLNHEQEPPTESQMTEVHAAEVCERKTCGTTPDSCADLLRSRQRFQPFSDDEIQDCVQLLPGDIVRLQQDNWQVGRSSFLQHGFYQYRHLLMGRMADGTYVLGVPGIRNQQESYMAQMFGFDRFKMSKICDCGRTFGYWYRRLEKRRQ